MLNKNKTAAAAALTFLWFLFLAPAMFSKTFTQERLIRVGIMVNKIKVSLTSSGEEISLYGNGGIRIGANVYPQKTLELYSTEGLLLTVEGRRYRGKIYVMVNEKGLLDVVNVLPLEAYLYGVMKMEIHPAWDEDAVKSQAIVSRTFALFNMKSDKPYDVVATVEDQVYGGVAGEDPRTTKSVDETRGQVLLYKGQLADVPFHADCGGYTENIETVWGGDPVPYLVARPCSFAKKTPYRHWKKTFSHAFIRRKLIAAGYNVGTLYKLKPLSVTRSGRTARILIQHAGGNLQISGQQFRRAIGYSTLPSTRFKIQPIKKKESVAVAELLPEQSYYVMDASGRELLTSLTQTVVEKADGISSGGSSSWSGLYVLRQEKSWTFTGSGWGHGVGMSQWDAQAMAKQGYTYKQILNYFYPGTQITQIYN